MILQQCTVSGNTATNDGGGLRNNQSWGIATSMKDVNRCEAPLFYPRPILVRSSAASTSDF